jgi:beta-alanine--pyruvate transaminase
VRNYGLVAAVELQPIAGAPTKRAFNVFLDTYERGVMLRTTGDTVVMTPPLIAQHAHIDQMVDTLRSSLRKLA